MGRSFNKSQLDSLQRALRRRRDQVLGELIRLTDPSEAIDRELLRLAAPVLGEDLAALVIIDSQRPRRREKLVEILLVERALQRLDEGRLGVCLGCGRLLPFAQLRIDPLLLRCEECGRGRDLPSSGLD